MKQPQPTKVIEETLFDFEKKKISIKEDPNIENIASGEGWIYVIDKQSKDLQQFYEFIQKIKNQDPVLICSNKCDLIENSLNLDIQKLGNKKHKIQDTNNKGDGIQEGFNWLLEQISQDNKEIRLEV